MPHTGMVPSFFSFRASCCQVGTSRSSTFRTKPFSTTCHRRTHYETLGLSPGASKSQIKSHFYKLSKQHHPDVSDDPQSKVTFRKASEAYAVLSNDRDRRAYDRSLLHRAPPPGSQTNQPFHPRAPHRRSARASYAWETRPRGPQRKPPFESVHPSSTRPQQTTSSSSSTHHGTPFAHPIHEDILKGTRKKNEEIERDLDRIRNESPLVRALQVVTLLVVSAGVLKLFGH